MKRFSLILATAFVLAASACAPLPDVEAERAALRDTERRAATAANQKEVEGWLAVFAEDASMFPPNAPIVTGKQALREWGRAWMATPGFAFALQPDKVEVSRAADLGYTLGTYQITMNDPHGNPLTERGKYVTVWKKQPDDSWKVVADIGNPNQPVVPAD
ncbi:MAG: YybH family protein [Terriglobia bacterium]